MENQFNDSQDVNSAITTYHKKEIGLPLIALCLDLVPVLLFFLDFHGQALSSLLIFIILSPIAGLITGVVSLSRGKDRIGIVGKILAIIAIILPISFVAFIFIFFIGAATGVISLM